ncbi:MAG: hypothetical protein ABW194_07150 [Novosphingobium sp.]
MKQFTLAAAVSVLAMGITALVATPIEAQPGRDAGANGVVTRAEARTAAAALWAKLDVNQDGVLNPADRTARETQRFAMIDKDGNGQISREEFAAAHGPRGDGAGKRGDRDGHAMGHGGRDGHRMGSGGHGGHRGMMAMRGGKAADTNGDGKLTRDEFNAAAELRFATADADKNGSITVAERQAARQKMRAEWRAAKPASPN